MTMIERQRTMRAYRLARLVQENLENRKLNTCMGERTNDDEALLDEAMTQEEVLWPDVEAIAARIDGKWGNYSIKELVEWWFLRDCPWDYMIPDDEWSDVEQAMLIAIAKVDY